MNIKKIKTAPFIKPTNGVPMQHKIELQEEKHTEEIQDIITKVPSWILRWGIMLFFVILLIAAGISVLVRYPDVVKANLKIITVTPSTPVTTTTPGILLKIFVNRGNKVASGQKLAYIQTGADPLSGYFLTSPREGNIVFISVIQQGSKVNAGQEIFRINPVNESFYGVTAIPQGTINKVKVGQIVHVNIVGYPVDEYGQMSGKVSFIADEPGKTGLFMVKVLFDKNNKLKLKEWMEGNVEIITEDVSLQARVYKNIIKGLR